VSYILKIDWKNDQNYNEGYNTCVMKILEGEEKEDGAEKSQTYTKNG
jgi:hypothetical protein